MSSWRRPRAALGVRREEDGVGDKGQGRRKEERRVKGRGKEKREEQRIWARRGGKMREGRRVKREVIREGEEEEWERKEKN